MIRVMLVDDHPMWRETLGKVLARFADVEVVAEAGDGDEAVRIVGEAAPDVVVMDVDLPTMSGIEATTALLDEHADARVLVLSGSEAREHVIAAVRAGAAGYLLKTAESRQVAQAVERIHAGEMVFPPTLASAVLEELRRRPEGSRRGGGATTVTLLFTDVEGSTALAERLGDSWPQLLAEHRELLRSVCMAHGGREVSARGDACVWEFDRASDGLRASVDAQRAFAAHDWKGPEPLRIRIGLHTGEPSVVDDAYEGEDLNRASRICDAGHGGQIVVSEVTRRLVSSRLPDGVALRRLGLFVLRGFADPEPLYRVDVDGLETQHPVLRASHAVPADDGGVRA